jgi:glycosyltransferase involved in cell wall biosynthesis
MQALAALKSGGHRVHALIVGDGQTKPSLEALAQKLGIADRVVFTGRVKPDEVTEYIAAMDAYAVPRRPETVCHLVSPLKPLEAMAMEKPVIVSNVGGMAGMVADGVTGYVHTAGDSQSLAEKIAQCARSEEERRLIASNARKFVASERTWSSIARSLLPVYKRLTGFEFDKA